MPKVLKKLGIIVLSVAVTLAVALGIVRYGQEQQQEEPMVSFDFWRSPFSGGDIGFLCEWHYPATNGAPGYVVVCYSSKYITQCYRIVGNRVTDYHYSNQGGLKREIEKITGPDGICLLQSDIEKNPERWGGYLCYQKKWRTHAARELEVLVRPFEAEGTGHVAILAWGWIHCILMVEPPGPDRSTVAVWSLNEVPLAVSVLRDAVKDFMADPSTREYHASYIRGYTELSPERSRLVPVRKGKQYPQDFNFRQRDVLRFLPCMDRALIPIEEGINPFKGFKTPFVPGSSLKLNYRSKEKDWRWHLHGDNFWRVEVYGGSGISD